MDTIHRGYLIKEGGQGHQYKNEKKRWFVLKDLFLFYYSGLPSPTKNMLRLKGFIYLVGCSTRDNPKKPETFILKSPAKEFVLSSISSSPATDILSWRNSIDYAIENSLMFKDLGVTSGWLTKKGVKGHNYQNWKKRYFVLRGNILFYYHEKDTSDQVRNVLHNLKGFIEISQITDIDADVSSDSNGFQFILTVNNHKSYILASKNMEEKSQWISALRQRIANSSKLSLQVALNTQNNETLIKTGELSRHINLKNSVKNFFILTNCNLRVYASKVDLNTISENWAKGMLACIPILGCSVVSGDEEEEEWELKPSEFSIIEIEGHAYILDAFNKDSKVEWVKAIKAASKSLAKSVINAGETIRLTCNASDKNGRNAGYTIMTIDKNNLTLKYLMLKKDVVIPFNKLKLVFLQPGFLFCLKYMQQDKAKQLKMKCPNASGIFDAVEAIFELAQDNQLTRHGTDRTLAHRSIGIQEIEKDTKQNSGKPKRRVTKEEILLSRQTADMEVAAMAVSASKADSEKARSSKRISKMDKNNNSSNSNNPTNSNTNTVTNDNDATKAVPDFSSLHNEHAPESKKQKKGALANPSLPPEITLPAPASDAPSSSPSKSRIEEVKQIDKEKSRLSMSTGSANDNSMSSSGEVIPENAKQIGDDTDPESSS